MDAAAESEFLAFVRASSPALHRTAYLMTGSRDRAQDAVQTALTRVYRAWGRRDRWDSREAYARRVVTNVVLSSAKRRWWGERPVAAVPDSGREADDTARVADRDALRRALVRLPVRQRTAVVLRHYADLSEADTAAAMGCAIGTVKSLTARGLAALRTELEEVAP